MDILRKIQDIVELIITGVAIFLMATIVLLTFLQIIFRNFLAVSFTQIGEIVRSEILWIAFVGAILTTLQGKHISIDVLPRYLSGKMQDVLKKILNAAAAIICLILFWYSISFIKLEMTMGTTTGPGIPAWILELILPIGFLLLALSFVLNFFLEKTSKERIPGAVKDK